MRTHKIASYLFLPFTVLWVLVAAFFWYQAAARQWEWEKATAVVASVGPDTAQQSADDSAIKYAFLSFRTAEGQQHQVRSKMGNSGKPLWSVGETVQVIYPANAPEAAEENLFIVQYILPLSITVPALLLSVVTALLFISAKRKSTHSKE